jgi:putative oxidoreductase
MTASSIAVSGTSTSTRATIENVVGLVGRILFAYIFITAGYGKLMNHAGTVGYIASGGMPIPAELAYWGAVFSELICGILVLVGFLARPAALVIAIFSLMTGYFFHLSHATGDAMAVMNQMIHFQKNIAIAGGALFIAAMGAGGWSVDAKVFGGRG